MTAVKQAATEFLAQKRIAVTGVSRDGKTFYYATNANDIQVQCSASSSVGGDTLEICSVPVTTRETS